MDYEIDRDAGIIEAYNKLRIGMRIQVLASDQFKNAIVMDKYLNHNEMELYMDILLEDGSVMEYYKCYSGWYPRYDVL